MFEQAVLSGVHDGHRGWSTLAGMAAQSALIAAAMVAPLLSPGVMPSYQRIVTVFGPPGPPPPPPTPGQSRPAAAKFEPRFQVRGGKLVAPSAVPPKPVSIEDPPEPAASAGHGWGVPGGIENGVPGGVLTSLLTGSAGIVPPQPAAPALPKTAPPPTAVTPEIQRIKVGGVVQEALLIDRVLPEYPVLARQMRISGMVQLAAVVGVDGRVKELRVLSGHPLLVKAALEAVRKWRYRPTYLNGNPVEVQAPITVFFKLQ